jgi:DNA-binding response OmpR family regulator
MTPEKSRPRVLYLLDERPTIAFVGRLLRKAAGLCSFVPEGFEPGAAALREMVVRVASLQNAGFSCDVGAISSDPIGKVVASSPSLIILDVVGYTAESRRLQRDLKQHPSTRSIPLIILTNDSRLRSRVRASRIGFQSYLVKPTMPTQLDQEIRRLGVGARGLRRGLDSLEASLS